MAIPMAIAFGCVRKSVLGSNRTKFKTMIRHARSRDKKRGFYDEDEHVDYTFILVSIILQNGQCMHCQKFMTPETVSLDRLDNDKPHVKLNCVMACLSCNHKRCKVKK